jgi:hypothetical protein
MNGRAISRVNPSTGRNRMTVLAALARGFGGSAAAVALVGWTLLLSPLPASAAAQFAEPEEGLKAFRAAVDSEGGKGLLDLFGKEYQADLIGGDPAAARQNLELLRRMAAQAMTLMPEGEGRRVIIMGSRAWPMPVPLVKGPTGWTFDVKEGVQEINDRRVGRNELSAIALCRAFIDAQREYASRDHDGDAVLEFAQFLRSTEGKQDGLYWKPSADGVASPLGPVVAQAEQYLQYRKEGEPFRGYYFRILKEQGANAPGGKHGYVINGNMIAGFAMIAWPADYGRSGIMTFKCGHNGQVLEKDLGAETAKLVSVITVYDPDKTWVPAEDQ